MILSNLNDNQKTAVTTDGNVMICACPGSGKTRVLTRRVAYELNERLDNTKQFVCALTYTNRASDEIKSRIDKLNIETKKLWAGTIHTFCLEWILRPNAGLIEELKNGFTIVDSHTTEELISALKAEYELAYFTEINTRFITTGYADNTHSDLLNDLYNGLKENKQVSFDLILHYAYRIITEYPLTAKSISNIFKIICVDEYQDTQELQYDILYKISKANNGATKLYFVGDVNQAIYNTLGGVAKDAIEIQQNIENEIIQLELSGNYRSSQRIINFYRNFQVDNLEIEATGLYRDSDGRITINQEVDKENLEQHISKLITYYIDNGVSEKEICVLAPSWRLVAPIGRRLKQILPNVSFDASGLSPFRKSRENFWYRIARLFLVAPAPNMYILRQRWAKEVIIELKYVAKTSIPEKFNNPKKILKIINSLSSNEEEGIAYLQEVFKNFIETLDIKLDANEYLLSHWDSFFESAQKILASEEYDGIPSDIITFKRMFKRRSGVVVNTCHGVKGEEYEVVISYGTLKGMIPNWEVVINGTDIEEENSAKKLLYVIASRAKKYLHLIAERGRRTQRRNPYETTAQLANVDFEYDDLINFDV